MIDANETSLNNISPEQMKQLQEIRHSLSVTIAGP